MGVSDPAVSVFLHDGRYLGTLLSQRCESVEIVTWNDHDWGDQLDESVRERGWALVRATSVGDALASSSGEFVIEWNVVKASTDALRALVDAAELQPDMRGALSANFDPAILWRRDEFLGPTGRAGLAQATGTAMDAGSSAGLVRDD